MAVTIDGTTGIDTVQDGIITSAKIASAGLAVSNMPSGSVIQTIQSVFTGGTSFTNTSFADTGHSASITPLRANSKIRVESFWFLVLYSIIHTWCNNYI